MSGMLHFLKDWWKLIQIHQYYTMALTFIPRGSVIETNATEPLNKQQQQQNHLPNGHSFCCILQRSADNMATTQPEGEGEGPQEDLGGSTIQEVTTVTTTKTTTYTVERTGDQV